MSEWETVGKIIRLQVQTRSMKQNLADGRRVYQPEGALASVDEIMVDSDGIMALIDGLIIIDKHNATHPESHNNGANPVSVGFTSHYDDMRSQFGDHVTDGLAGENIIVQTAMPIPEAMVDADIVFKTASGDYIILQDVYAMPPCEPFTRYCLSYAPGEGEAREIKSGLQFLSKGVRGFAGTPNNAQKITLRVGDKMLVRRL
ncbi:MAG: hypothetical protein L0154_13700 [Chloroflexi bacterium]|nr:hypothetical protein [Chloroflexota bacterium]